MFDMVQNCGYNYAAPRERKFNTMLLTYLAMIDTDEDQSLFEEIYFAYRKQMIYIANEVLHDYALAEDAVQDALLGIAKRIEKLRDLTEDRRKAYVLTAAKNAAINIYTKEQSVSKRQIEYAYAESVAVDDAFLRLDQDGVVRTLMKIIAAMPTASRDVLLYRYVEEMSCAEISAVLGKTTRTVSKQLTRARRSLREGCKREGLSFED